MIGGDDEAVARLDPVFETLAPGVESAPRTPGRDGEPSPAERGYLHCGPSGAGHFVKMVHNGIEYGLMAAYAEGLNVLRHANAGAERTDPSTPRRRRCATPSSTGTTSTCDDIAEVWRRGSVVASWLLDLTAAALHEAARSRGLRGSRRAIPARAAGRAIAAIDRRRADAGPHGGAVRAVRVSRGEADFAGKVLSAMRFGVRRARRAAPPSDDGATP